MAYKYRAAGAIVLRGSGADTEVLVIHRPKPDLADWSLPKGSIESGEAEPVTAVREVLEETGYSIRLAARLQPTRHIVKERTKVVSWWLGELTSEQQAEHDQEADLVEWWPIGKALAKLSYQTDLSVLTEAVRYREKFGNLPVPLLIVRHGKATPRRQFKGDDDNLRPLATRGERQAESLIGLFEAFGVAELASSSAKRCVDTLQPYAQSKQLTISRLAELTEQAASDDPKRAAKAMRQIRDRTSASGRPTAVCGHRPVLPTMTEALKLDVDHSLETAETIFTTVDTSAQVHQQACIPPEV